MVAIKIKSIVACKQAFQADAAVPFHRSLTNGWARTASHTKSTINHTLANTALLPLQTLHCTTLFMKMYRKCSWHCPDLYWTFMHCILWSFTQILVIIVVTNTINVKNNMNILIHEEIEVIPFLKGAVDFHN